MVRQGSGLEIIDIANPEASRRAVQHMKASADKQIGIGSMGEDGRAPPPPPTHSAQTSKRSAPITGIAPY